MHMISSTRREGGIERKGGWRMRDRGGGGCGAGARGRPEILSDPSLCAPRIFNIQMDRDVVVVQLWATASGRFGAFLSHVPEGCPGRSLELSQRVGVSRSRDKVEKYC